MLKINNQSTFNFYIVFSLCIFFVGLVLTEFLGDLQPIMISFFIMYIYTVIYSVSSFGWLSLYCIYLYTSAFFLYNCIFLSLLSFSPTAFLFQDFPVRYSFSEEVGKKFVISCFVTVFTGHITFCWFESNKHRRKIIKKNLNIFKN